MNIISRQIICTGIIVLVMVGAIVVLLNPGLFFPVEDKNQGSLQWIFYDTNGDEIDQLSYWAGGVEIGGFKIVCTLSAVAQNLVQITVTGDFHLTIFGYSIDPHFPGELIPRELETIPGSLYGEDTTSPYRLVFEFPFDISILDAYSGYKDRGWQIAGHVSTTIEGHFANGDTRVKDWSGRAWFDVEWRLDDFQLTGDMGYEYD